VSVKGLCYSRYAPPRSIFVEVADNVYRRPARPHPGDEAVANAVLVGSYGTTYGSGHEDVSLSRSKSLKDRSRTDIL